MQYKLFSLLSVTLLLTTQVHAGPYDTYLKQEVLDDEEGINKESPPNFWEWSGFGNAIGKSHFRTPGFKDQQIKYNELQTLLSYNYWINNCTAISIGAGYSHVNIDWAQNPDFRQTNFDTACVTVAGLTKADRWLLRAMLTARFSTDARQVNDYVLYTQAFWARYDLTPCYGTHFGYVLETGMSKNTIWPILGLDWKYSDCLKFFAVYPFEANVHYDFCDPFAVEVALRRFRYRDRVGAHEPDPKGLLEYRNGGTEIRLVFESSPYIAANVHVGYSYGGEIRISDSKDNNAIHYKFEPAPYAGGEFSVKF